MRSTLFLGAFVLWAALGNNPFGGEPMVVAKINAPSGPAASGTPNVLSGLAATDMTVPPKHRRQAAQGAPAAAPNTITIIDGKTGQRQEVEIAGPASDAAAPAVAGASVDQKFAEMTPHGLIPKVAADGVRPADAFAEPVKTLPGKPDAPRIAIIISGLGVSDSATADAISKLPGAVTLSFMPYGSNVAALATRAHDQGHEVLLQVPMEPFDYPDNDPGPQTL